MPSRNRRAAIDAARTCSAQAHHIRAFSAHALVSAIARHKWSTTLAPFPMKLTKPQGAAICAAAAVATVLVKAAGSRYPGIGDFFVTMPAAFLFRTESLKIVCLAKLAFLELLFWGACWMLPKHEEKVVPIATVALVLLAIAMSSLDLVIA